MENGKKIRKSLILCAVMIWMLLPVSVQAGEWKKNAVGWWWQEDYGTYPVSTWENIRGRYYAFDERGYMRSGWFREGESWYYLGGANDGAMKTGWQKVNGKWYWMNRDGRMASGWVTLGSKNYYLGDRNDGAMKSGWLRYGADWYYLGGPEDGSMKTGWQRIGGAWYYMYNDGRMAANTWIGPYYVNQSGAWMEGAVPSQWIHSGNRWWYRHTDGSYTVNNWETIGGKKYYFDGEGWMKYGWQVIGGDTYYFGQADDGALKTNQWIGESYVGQDGKMAKNAWIEEYYVDQTGKRVKNQWVGESYVAHTGKLVKDQWIGDFYVDKNGKLVKNQWLGESYVGQDGKLVKNQWVEESYVDEDGKLVKSQWIGDYYVDQNGKLAKNQWIGDFYVGEDGKRDEEKEKEIPLQYIWIPIAGTDLEVGEEMTIGLAYVPANTTERTVKWTSSNPDAVSVDETGKVTAKSVGGAEITASVGNKQASCRIVVRPEGGGIGLDLRDYPLAYYINAGDSVAAHVQYCYDWGNVTVEEGVTWRSSDDSIVTVENGMIQAVRKGRAYIYADVNGYELMCEIVVQAYPPLTQISFDTDTMTIKKNYTGKVTLITEPEDYPYEWSELKWGSTNENVAKIDRYGNITALNGGETTVYMEIENQRAECLVTVLSDDQVEYYYDTSFAEDVFEKVNQMRTAEGIHALKWDENDAARASAIRAGKNIMKEQNGFLDSPPLWAEQNQQLGFRSDREMLPQRVLNAWTGNQDYYPALMDRFYQTAGCACVVKKVNGKIKNMTVVFTLGGSEEDLAGFSQEERDVYWSGVMGIPQSEFETYLAIPEK